MLSGGVQKIVSAPQTLNLGVWISFDLIMTVPWLFPLAVRKYFIGAHS